MLVGVTDPIAFLDNAGNDWDIACTVVQQAQEMRHKERREELTAVVKGIGDAVGSQIARMLPR